MTEQQIDLTRATAVETAALRLSRPVVSPSKAKARFAPIEQLLSRLERDEDLRACA